MMTVTAATFFSPSSDTHCQQPAQPLLIGHSIVDGATLGIPRWKGYMSQSNPQNFWASYANGGSGFPSDISYTTDGGESWSSQDIQISADGRVDFHLSLYGLNEELYYTYPDNNNYIAFRKFNSPAHDNSDRGPLTPISGTSAAHRSNITVQSSGRIWLFTRLGNNPGENVLYHYSDNNGSSWTSGAAYSTGANNVRIGSMPYVGGNPALLVLYIGDPRGYEYYLWNGSSFEAKADHSVFPQNMNSIRVFTHNTVRDTTFHLVFGLGNDLYHVWKNYNNGTGSWNTSIIESSPFTADNDWLPTSVVRGDDLYLFYCEWTSGSVSTSMIYYKKWSQLSQTWTDPVLVSTDPDNVGNRDPNTCPKVPESADYIPVFWSSSTGGFNIYFSKLILDPNDIDDDDQSALPSDTQTCNNYPNPFNSGTNIRFNVENNCLVNITVYDVLGRAVGVILNEFQSPGLKNVKWTCQDNTSGVYYYRIKTGDNVICSKMTLVK